MPNQPQKKKTRFLSPSAIRERWRSSRSPPPSPSNAAQTGPSVGLSASTAPSPLTSRSPSPSGHNTVIQSVAPPASAAQANSSKPDQPSSYPGKEYAKTTLKGVYELLKVLKESSDAFPPLKSAVGGFVACVEVYKNTSGNHEEMERVLKSTDQLASTLAAKLEESKDHKPLDQIIKKLSKSLEEEDKKIKAMQERRFIVRLAHNSDDAGELISSCQAIKDALDTFYVGLTLLMERNTHDILKHVVFQTLPRSRDAAFSAAINLDNVSRGPCTRDTRVDIIEQIMEWAKETDPVKAPSVYWLNGLAGLGKTTIAYTICERLEEAGVSFASFFCSRQLDSKNSKLLVTTLCRDLAELFSSFAFEVLPVLERDSKIVDAQLHRQMAELLAKPWQASLSRRDRLPVPIVVVDALDESDRGTDFLRELLRVVESGELAGIRFLVTSRPEPTLIDLCKSFPPNAVCKLHEVDLSNVQKDIEKYLCEALPDLKDEPVLAELAGRAGGFFIYAATAVRFISPDPPFSAPEQLSQLQDMLSSWPTMAAGGERLAVDELYEQILAVAFGNSRVLPERLQILHTVLCAETRINISVIANLSNIDQKTVKAVIDSLHAVLFVSSKDACVYWYHTSFPDFIFTLARAKFKISLPPRYLSQEINVFCGTSSHHAVLAQQCFSIMQKLLHFNMCDLESSYIMDSDVPDLNDRIHKKLTPTLQYASRHWARHLFRAVPPENDANKLFLCLNEFMGNKLVFWMEAMNLIDAKFECSPLLKAAEDWVKQGKQDSDLLEYLADATNFSTFFAGSPAANSTPHLYISALSTWYQDLPIWKHWKHRFTCIPLVSLSGGAIAVPLLTMRVETNIRSVAFSPDGNQIVSGSGDQSVRVWDAKTGEQLRELQGHTSQINVVAFLPDANQITSGLGNELACVFANSSLDTSWVIDEHGWILSAAKPLIWIPPTIRNVLHHSYSTLIISRHGSATISFGDGKLGALWHRCYTP